MKNKNELIKYYKELDRSYFMDEYKELANQDRPFPIGHGQTISQPSLVLRMTILLSPDDDSKVLEIGTGSGYQTALLAKVSKEVYTVERIEELYIRAKERFKDLDFDNIEFRLDDGSLGWQENAPYDRIMVTATASKIPKSLLEQLAPNGKMIIPVGKGFSHDLMLVRKDSKGKTSKEVLDKVRFVKLIGEYEK